MHRPSAHPALDFDAFYRTHWDRIVRFCARCLASLPDGTAEEVAQDVFLAAYSAITQQRYRGESTLSTWLFGIARNLCARVRRDARRKTTPDTLRRLEREVTRLERDVMSLEHDPSPRARQQGQRLRARLTLVHVWLERERERLQAQMLAHVHGTPGAPPEEPVLTPAPRQALRRSMQRLARRDRQAYTVLRMHVVRGISVDEIAALQGMSRSAVYRCLTRAKAECYKVYRASIAMERHRATGEQRPQTMRDF